MSFSWISITVSLIAVNCVLFLAFGNAFGEEVKARRTWFVESSCLLTEFQCSNGDCISKHLVCNGNPNCRDRSDEANCRESYCNQQNFFICRDNYYKRFMKCIPKTWMCDGSTDCANGEDELNCRSDEISLQRIQKAKLLAREWMLSLRNENSSTHKWSSEVARIAVALFLAHEKEFLQYKYKDEIAYELIIRVLSGMALRKFEDMPTAELASYVNAFLVTCIDYGKFFLLDLVTELRNRLTSMNTVNPFVALTICNAGEELTDNDVQKLINTFRSASNHRWIDTQAFVIMALSCAATQNPKYLSEIPRLISEITKNQQPNGMVENVKTTALVMQALLASQGIPDEIIFDEDKALKQILLSQQHTGRFEDITDTYYVLPVLAGKSLLNISSSHCKITSKDGSIPSTLDKGGIDVLLNHLGLRLSIQYSLWIGDNKTLTTTLALKIPVNFSFYHVMEYAAGIDHRFEFKYNMRNGKPNIYYLWNKPNYPEFNMFWVPFSLSRDGSVKSLVKSPSDVILIDKQHLVFWYKTEILPPLLPLLELTNTTSTTTTNAKITNTIRADSHSD